MIKLTKDEKPAVLEQNEQNWTREFIEGLEVGNLTDTTRYRYRHPDIKAVLKAETHDKCAYCESKVSHVHPGETDHILPKLKRPDLVVSWANLTFVCTECNRRKLDYYSLDEPLINPYVNEPSEHLWFVGPLVLHQDDAGFRTTRRIKLSRTELIERKQESIEQVNMLVQKWRETGDGATKEFLRQEIVRYKAACSEFSATMAAFLASIPGLADETAVHA